MHVAIIGAGGKVAKQTIQQLFSQNATDLNLTLHSKTPRKIEGALLDIEDSLYLANNNHPQNHKFPRTNITGNLFDISGADLTIVTLGVWPTVAEKEQFQKIDNTGRLVQSYANYNTILETSEEILKYAPNSLVVIVTNQSDMMTMAARQVLNPQNVIGMGGMLDTTRFRHSLAKKLHDITYLSDPRSGHIVGYHNNDMFLLSDSVQRRYEYIKHDILDEALAETKIAGAKLSKLQKDLNYPEVNSGPSVLPGLAIATFINAYAGEAPSIEESFNIYLTDKNIAKEYGLETGNCISIPAVISQNKYEVCSRFSVLPAEKEIAQLGFKKLMAGFEVLKNNAILLPGKKTTTFKKSPDAP